MSQKNDRKKVLFILLFFALSNMSLLGQGQSISSSLLKSTIELDGHLTETDWQTGTVADQFYMSYPYDTTFAQSQTEVRVLHDKDNLYIGAKCYGKKNGKYVVQSLKRDFDFLVNDAFTIFIDAFSDATNGLCFSVNPYGVQCDGIVADGGLKGLTTSWDALWFSEVYNNPIEGFWSVEIAIPFKSLRFDNAILNWKINFTRTDLNRNERSSWVPIPRGFKSTILSSTGQLTFEHFPKQEQNGVTLVPYIATGINQNYDEKQLVKMKSSIGLDAKVALNSSLNLDLTINPDFSQVEVDQQVINLNRFELFFPEKRLFFLENSDLFSYLGNSRVRPFFSRRIGSAGNDPIPILFGARLSGKLDKNWRLGLMSMQTKAMDDIQTKSQNYSVAALQRKIFKGSNLTLFMTNKQGFDDFYHLNEFNRVGGMEFEFRSKDSKIRAKTFGHYSWTQDKLSKSHAYSAKIRYKTKQFNIFTGIDAVGENYLTNMGFVPRLYHSYLDEEYRIAYSHIRMNGRYRFFNIKSSLIDYISPLFFLDIYTDKNFRYQEHKVKASIVVRMMNTSQLSFSYLDYSPILFFPFTLSGLDIPLSSGNYNNQSIAVEYNTGQRKQIFGKFKLEYGGEYLGKLFDFSGEVNYRKQPWGVFGLSLSQQNLMHFPEEYGYANFTLIGSKMELSFSRKLFFATFLQYNTQIQNFNINSRFNWRFKPMSDLYIVYTENYTSTNLAIKNRALILKLSYWFNP